MITKMINGQERPVSNSGDSLGSSITLNGNPLSFSKDTAGLASNTVITLEPIQEGSGDPSPSNVRAISGYEKVEIAVPRKNLAFKSIPNVMIDASGVIQSSSNRIAYVGMVESGTVYTATKGSYENNVYAFYQTEPFSNSVSYNQSRVVEANAEDSFSFTAPINGYVVFITSGSYTVAQLEKGSTATAYEPYNPLTDLSIAMPGTIYGGTLDVESGELVVDRASLSFSSVNWTMSTSGSNRYFADNIPNCVTSSLSLCSNYKLDSTSISSMSEDSYKISDNGALYVVDNSYTSAADFKSANTNTILVYLLATPITYHLTPHQVALLQGANVVTTNGTSISLTHRQGQIAAQEDLVALADGLNAISNVDDLSIHTSFNTDYIGSVSTKSVFRCGRIIAICLDLYVTTAVPPSVDVLRNLPLPMYTVRTFFRNGVEAYINTNDGKLYTNAGLSTGWTGVNIVYISK